MSTNIYILNKSLKNITKYKILDILKTTVIDVKNYTLTFTLSGKRNYYVFIGSFLM